MASCLRVGGPRLLIGLHLIDELLARIGRVRSRHRRSLGAKASFERALPSLADLSVFAFMRVEHWTHVSPRRYFSIPVGGRRRRPLWPIDPAIDADRQLVVPFGSEFYPAGDVLACDIQSAVEAVSAFGLSPLGSVR